jgi:hypothetical protein
VDEHVRFISWTIRKIFDFYYEQEDGLSGGGNTESRMMDRQKWTARILLHFNRCLSSGPDKVCSTCSKTGFQSLPFLWSQRSLFYLQQNGVLIAAFPLVSPKFVLPTSSKTGF